MLELEVTHLHNILFKTWQLVKTIQCIVSNKVIILKLIYISNKLIIKKILLMQVEHLQHLDMGNKINQKVNIQNSILLVARPLDKVIIMKVISK